MSSVFLQQEKESGVYMLMTYGKTNENLNNCLQAFILVDQHPQVSYQV
jgi:hypothetical protein